MIGPQPPDNTSKVRRVLPVLGLLSLLLTVGTVALFDATPLSMLSHFDYLSIMYAAGAMVRDGLGDQLYPPTGSTDYVQAPFNIYSHRLLPQFQADITATFAYPPTAACFFVPFSFLPPRLSFITWQLLSVLSLYVSAWIYGARRRLGWLPFLCVFTFFPVLHVLILGQPTFVFAFLPLVAGLVLWSKNRNFLAGLIWSMLCLKGQLLLVALIPALACVLATVRRHVESSKESTVRSRIDLLVGLASGSALLVALPVLVVGPNSIKAWLSFVPEFARAFMGSEVGDRYALVGSLPLAFSVLVPVPHPEIYSRAVQIFVAGMLALLFWVTYKVMSSNYSWQFKQRLAITLSLGALPLVSPYLRIYDLSMWVLLLWFYLFDWPDGKSKAQLGQWLLVSWLGLDLYYFICTWSSASRHVLLAILVVIAFMYVRFCFTVLSDSRINQAEGK